MRPGETRVYLHDWTPFLVADTIVTETTTAVGITLDDVTIEDGDQSVTLTVTAVDPGLATITQTIETAGGLTETGVFTLLIANADEILTLEEAKAHLRKTTDDEDALICTCLRAARQWVEDHTGHILYQRTFIRRFDAWGDYLTLYDYPVTEITSITYDGTDEDDDQIEYDGFEYSTGQHPLRIYPASSFPTLRTNGYITITYTAGYATGESPDALIQAVKLQLGNFYNMRSGVSTDTPEETPLAVRSLCRPYRGAVMA